MLHLLILKLCKIYSATSNYLRMLLLVDYGTTRATNTDSPIYVCKSILWHLLSFAIGGWLRLTIVLFLLSPAGSASNPSSGLDQAGAIGVGVGVGIPFLVMIICVPLVCVYCCRRRHRKSVPESPPEREYCSCACMQCVQ